MSQEVALTMPEEKIGGRNKWEVESDLRTLQSADEIKRDSNRVKAVSILAKQQIGTLRGLARKRKFK